MCFRLCFRLCFLSSCDVDVVDVDVEEDDDDDDEVEVVVVVDEDVLKLDDAAGDAEEGDSSSLLERSGDGGDRGGGLGERFHTLTGGSLSRSSRRKSRYSVLVSLSAFHCSKLIKYLAARSSTSRSDRHCGPCCVRRGDLLRLWLRLRWW